MVEEGTAGRVVQEAGLGAKRKEDLGRLLSVCLRRQENFGISGIEDSQYHINPAPKS